jgi:hypothetical protein
VTNSCVVAPELERRLTAAGFTVRALEENASVVYIVGPELDIAYCNPAWDAFAAQNGGKHLERRLAMGRSCLPMRPEFLRTFYELAFKNVTDTQKPWSHDYECSSPERYRRFRMRVFPLHGGHLLVENSLYVEGDHEQASQVPIDHSRYINENGFIAMCSHCRRTRARGADGSTAWDWVPSYLKDTPVLVSHTLCHTCLAYHYKISMK